jgi:hypothetical protein
MLRLKPSIIKPIEWSQTIKERHKAGHLNKKKSPKKFGRLKNLMYLYYIRLKLIGDERYSVFNLGKKL